MAAGGGGGGGVVAAAKEMLGLPIAAAGEEILKGLNLSIS